MATFENKVSGPEEPAIVGVSEQYTGVWGESHGPASGVYGRSISSYGVNAESDSSAAVRGTSKTGRGVEGWSETTDGVFGWSRSGFGVNGFSPSNTGVAGGSDAAYGVTGDGGGTYAGVKGASRNGTGRGVEGWSTQNSGVWGISTSGAGVEGASTSGDGVVGVGRRGVVGISETYQGVFGKSGDNSGVVGESDRMHAMFAVTHSATSAGVFATNTAGGNAGLFQGDVRVTGDLILDGADVAEQFYVDHDAGIAAGCVVVLDDHGHLTTTTQPYDTRVAGIVSGAGDREPALVLDREPDGVQGGNPARRMPLAVAGKAWCLADATHEPIKVGDLLTTAARPAHAMRVGNRLDAIGAVIGKALTPLREGTGPVLVLVGLA